jgi:oligopeptidase B
MKKLTSLFFLLCILVSGIYAEQMQAPPVAPKHPKVRDIHGYKTVDDYFWLREKTNPEVMKYLKAEDAYTEMTMKPTEKFQQSLYKEMLSHIKQTDVTVPYRSGGYYYYTRTEEGKQYPIYCRKRGDLNAAEEVVLDQNELAKGQSFMSVDEFAPNDDNSLLAYTTDNTGYRQFTLHVKDLTTGKVLSEKIERVTSLVWSTDNKTIFYVTEDAVNKRSNQFYRHTVGSDRSDLIYDEKDEIWDLYTYRSLDKAVIFLQCASKTSNEVRYSPANDPAAAWKIISEREPEHEYDAEHRGDLFYIRSNKGAKNFRIVTAPESNPSQKNWKEFIEHRPAIKINSIDLFRDHAVLSEWQNGLQQLEVVDFKTNQKHRIEFPEPVYAAFVSVNKEFDTDVVRYSYQSLVTPPSIFDYNMNTRQAKLMKQTEVPGGFDKANYKSERAFAAAADGTRIPLSIVYRKNVKLDGNAPLLLYAYGSYGASISPTFSSNILSLLDRGVIYVIAHIRGGGELGEEWREQGRMMKKITTFTDFINSAEYLIQQKYTSKDKLIVEGASAGGLLMGAVTNMRPDLFKAVVAKVPFVDVINTMLDASIPLTAVEFIEWGNPANKNEYDYMIQYSPYDNVKKQAYPAMLVKVSVNDSQVPYWEGTKMLAKIRAMKTDNHPQLLKVNFGAGHSGSSGRYDSLKETAFDYAFMLWQWGIMN